MDDLHFLGVLWGFEFNAFNLIVAMKTTVGAMTAAVIRKVQRRIKANGATEMLAGDASRFLGQLF